MRPSGGGQRHDPPRACIPVSADFWTSVKRSRYKATLLELQRSPSTEVLADIRDPDPCGTKWLGGRGYAPHTDGPERAPSGIAEAGRFATRDGKTHLQGYGVCDECGKCCEREGGAPRSGTPPCEEPPGHVCSRLAAATLTASGAARLHVMFAGDPEPRTLSAREGEALMGFPPDHTRWGRCSCGAAYELSREKRLRLAGNAFDPRAVYALLAPAVSELARLLAGRGCQGLRPSPA